MDAICLGIIYKYKLQDAIKLAHQFYIANFFFVKKDKIGKSVNDSSRKGTN